MLSTYGDDFSYMQFSSSIRSHTANDHNSKKDRASKGYDTEFDDKYGSTRFFKRMNLHSTFRPGNIMERTSRFSDSECSGVSALISYDYAHLIDCLVSASACNDVCYSVSEMIDKIKKVFGLSISNIATIVGVSRATIYNHVSCSSFSDVSEYQKIFHLSLEVERKGFNVVRGLKSVSVDGKTLLKYLTAQPLNQDEIISVCEIVSRKLETMTVSKPTSVYDQKLTTIINN